MEALGHGFVHIPCIGPFQIIEQDLVQCCEPHIEPKSCKAFQLYLD